MTQYVRYSLRYVFLASSSFLYMNLAKRICTEAPPVTVNVPAPIGRHMYTHSLVPAKNNGDSVFSRGTM